MNFVLQLVSDFFIKRMPQEEILQRDKDQYYTKFINVSAQELIYREIEYYATFIITEDNAWIRAIKKYIPNKCKCI